ncbi:MAG: catechol 2,3-dioxygenase-like lactoylglutathione lyase family enzyme [Bradymonadia bacterium]|jgi:catechol 2,3-dioxygenase-like lactoylglutathione lyase family enzyme
MDHCNRVAYPAGMGTFDHVHIYSADVANTIEFYRGVLGAQPIGDLGNSAGGKNHLYILGGQYLAISEFPAGMEAKPPAAALDGALDVGFGMSHFGFNVVNLETTLARAIDAGCEAHSAPKTSGPLKYAYVTGPDGVVIEFTEYVLPMHLRPAGAALQVFNAAVHVMKRVIGRALIAAA